MAGWLEACMVVCFGVSWPISIARAWRAKTAKGKSLWFLVLILAGYGCGIASKLASGRITYVFVFYCLNFAMLLVEIAVYFRNARLDKNGEGLL